MTIKRFTVAPVDSPAPFSVHVAASIKALAGGTATQHQQQTAYEWIIKHASGIGAQSFRSGDSHATAFMEGRRFVAAQLIALETINMEELKKRTTNGD